VGGILTNFLLLFAIRRFSRQSVGTYKYLLAIFASFDIFLTIIHRLTNPVKVIKNAIVSLKLQTVVTIRIKEITGAYCAFFTVPFALMNIHFLYRFWAIRHPEKIILFSNKKFIALISMAPISVFVSWHLICTRIMSGAHDEIGTIRLYKEYFRRYGKKIRDGWILVNFSEEDGMRTLGFISMLTLDVIMIGSFSIAITLAILTYHYITLADTKISSATINLQFKLLIAVCAQTFVPLVFVYLPYMGVNNLAVLRVPAYPVDRVCMQLTACFPLWDALIIIVLIRDYREGVISLVRKKKVIDTKTTVWKT
ncbi:hypothetical protein PMAYCL1PPCAC_17011, partial [Pristionchus mayeri]